MPPAGYIGPLPGLYFDPIRGKYFTDRPSTTGSGPGPSTSASRNAAINTTTTTNESGRLPRRPVSGRGRKAVPQTARPAIESTSTTTQASGSGGTSTNVRRKRNYLGTRGVVSLARSRTGGTLTCDGHEKSLYANLTLDEVKEVAGDGDSITSLQNFPNGKFQATTKGGYVIVQTDDTLPSAIPVCSENLIGMHLDLARFQGLVVTSGDDPHIHHWKWDLYNPHGAQVVMDAKPLSHDVHCMSSFDSFCSIGATRSLITVRFDKDVRIVSRNLPSDALAIHHHSHDIRYLGLRNSQVIRADLRAPSHTSNIIASMQRGKAVVGIKKLDDAAVPFGLLASGMLNELLLFDVRFGKKPIRALPGHINSFHSNLGLATAANDKVVFAAGSDNRLRAWSLLSGERLRPDHDSNPDLVSRNSRNPLTRSFSAHPTAISITEDGMMDVGVGHAIHRFRPRRDGPSRTSESAVRNWEASDTFM